MNLYPELVQALAEASPLVLVVLIAGGALIAMVIFLVRGVTPAIGRIIEQQSEAANKQCSQHGEIVKAWKTLLEEQNRVNATLSDGLKRELAEERGERIAMENDLRERMSGLQRELDDKTRQLDEARARISELERQLEVVKEDRDRIQNERDELKRRVEKLTTDVERLRNELKKYKRANDSIDPGNGVHPSSGNPDTDAKPCGNGDGCSCKRDAKPNTKPDAGDKPDTGSKPDRDTE